MDANPDDEEVPPDPPDRISYLLPEGCSDIVDAWNLEKELKERGEVKKRVAMAFIAEGMPPVASLALPPSLTMRELAERLGREFWEINKVLVEIHLFMKLDSVMDYDTAARVCARLGIVPRPEGGG